MFSLKNSVVDDRTNVRFMAIIYLEDLVVVLTGRLYMVGKYILLVRDDSFFIKIFCEL